MSDLSNLLAPGEPAPADPNAEPASPASVADIDQPTGTDIDNAPDIPAMSDEAIEAALAAAMRGEELDDQANTIPPAVPEPVSAGGTAGPDLAATGPASTDQGSGASPQTAPTPDPAGGPVPATPPAPTAPSTYTLPGVGEIDASTAQQIAELYAWAQGLDTAQAQAVNDLFSGQYRLTPVQSDPTAASGLGVPAPAPGVGAGPGAGSSLYTPTAPNPAVTSPGEFDPSQYADPELARLVHQQQAALANLAAQQQAVQQQAAQQAAYQVQQEQARLQSEADIATTAFADAHQLDPATTQRLVQTATQMQIIPSLFAKHGNDPRKAMNEALEVAYWSDPQTRAQAIQSQIEQFASQSADTDDKKRRAAALTGSGGAVPRTLPAAQPLTKQQREDAMIGEIAAHMNGSQS